MIVRYIKTIVNPTVVVLLSILTLLVGTSQPSSATILKSNIRIAVPTGIEFSRVTTNSFHIAWDQVANNGGYRVQIWKRHNHLLRSVKLPENKNKITIKSKIKRGKPYFVSVQTLQKNGTTNSRKSKKLKVVTMRFRVGETGPGGGLIYFVSSAGFACGPTGASQCHYLEAATKIVFEPNFNYYAIPEFQTTLIGASAQHEGIGSGYLNTLAIISQNGPFVEGSNVYEAGSAHNYAGEGLHDWYLPSKDELVALYEYFDTHQSGSFAWFANQCVFNSSTEVDATRIWMLEFGTGHQIVAEGKSGDNFFIPVRSF
jgi:hypothetical protein